MAQPYSIATVAGGALPASGTPATQDSIGDPPRVAVDRAGNVYFGSLHAVFKVDSSGTLIRVAGTGRPGNAGDGGPALNAQMMTPAGIVADGSGNLYVADMGANTVRKIASDGTISTYAGNGTAGYTGDNGPATQAQLNTPDGLALDAAGKLYIADRNNHAIRVVSPGGTILTAAGNGLPGFSGDGLAATAAQLDGPEGLAFDGSGNLYIADTQNDRVRMVNQAGIISTVAGTGTATAFTDGGPAASTGLILPTGVAVDPTGSLYIADYGNSRIRVVSAGNIITVAGSFTGAPLANGGNALSVLLNGPTGVAVDGNGNVYFTEGSIGSGSGLAQGDFRVWRVSPASELTVLAGTGSASYSGDGGSATSAQMWGPTGVATDGAGNIYFADTGNHRIREVGADGAIRTIAGTGQAGFSGDGEPANTALLNSPTGVAFDANGLLIIADSGNSRIRAILPNGVIFTLMGNGNSSYYGDGLNALAASLNHPQGVAIGPDGEVYVADTQNNVIRKRDAGGVITTVAGMGPVGFSGDGGLATSALLKNPTGVSVDRAGNIYIVDAGNQRIREVTTDGVIHTVAGPLANPNSIAVDSSGNVFFTTGGDHRVLRIAAGGQPAPIAGTGDCCYTGDGGPAVQAALDAPWGITVDASSGTLYLADSASNAVRALIPASAAPNLKSVVNGASNQNAAISPGEVVVLYGSGLGPAQLTVAQPVSGQYPIQLAGTTVYFNGVPGLVLYASAVQVGAVAPTSLIAGSAVSMTVGYRDLLTSAVPVTAAAVSPGIFTLDGTGTGQAAAINADGSVNSAAHPASGSLTLYATGIAGASVQALIGGTAANTLSVDAQTGVTTVTIQIPAGVSGPAVPVVIQANGASSQNGVTVAISAN